MWRCLIIEDDADNANDLRERLSAEGHAAFICSDGASGLQRASQEQWDIIVLDRMLPDDTDGLSILSALRALNNSTPVLVLSALTGLDERVRGLKAGGDDYLTKPFAFAELAARIEALIRRSTSKQDGRYLQVADLVLDLLARRATRAGKPIALQPREFNLLAYMVRHSEQVLTRTMLLASVWDYHFDPQTNIIEAQISRLRQKIDNAFELPLVRTVRGVGYMISASYSADKPPDKAS